MSKQAKAAAILGCIIVVAALSALLTANKSGHDSDVVTYDGTPDLTATPERPTVIDFNATWCGPCMQFAPIFRQTAQEHAGDAVFYSVDVDQHAELAHYYGVTAIPKLVVLFPDGTRRESIGLISREELESLIAE